MSRFWSGDNFASNNALGKRLPDDMVCACLLETGERKVEIVERCIRCGSLMYSDAYHDALADNTRLREALRQIAEYFASEYREGDKAYQAVIIARAALAGEDT